MRAGLLLFMVPGVLSEEVEDGGRCWVAAVGVVVTALSGLVVG